jgi:hypothetical protein
MMMVAETASETFHYNSILTRPIAREYFIPFSRRESLKTEWIVNRLKGEG